MKPQQFRDMTREELARRIDELNQELMNLRFQAATKQLTDTSRIGQVRRDVARAMTILRELELKAEGR
jgi:large subunit ribosomal protein L29